jgi:YD repeat-containing protein
MSFGYDSLRRLQEVHDVDGSVTTFSYDAVGNRIGVSRPNGVTTESTFDALNRPHAITHRNSSNSVLASFLYELGPAGTRTAITEADGRRVDYTYDHTHQLRSETVTGGVGAGSTFFSYDANGNRAPEATASGTRSYTYDANDRLLSDGVASYTFGANGNMRTRTSSAGTMTFTWDARDRLIAVTTPLHGIQHVYAKLSSFWTSINYRLRSSVS